MIRGVVLTVLLNVRSKVVSGQGQKKQPRSVISMYCDGFCPKTELFKTALVMRRTTSTMITISVGFVLSLLATDTLPF